MTVYTFALTDRYNLNLGDGKGGFQIWISQSCHPYNVVAEGMDEVAGYMKIIESVKK